MPKVFVAAVLIGSVFAPAVVLSNDYASNKNAWISHEKTTCFSIDNLDEYKNNFLVLYDYSTNVGTKLGRPWALVEQGKCYEIDFTNEEIFLFRYPLTPEVENIFSKEKNSYTPGTNISDIIKTCEYTRDSQVRCSQGGIFKLKPFDEFYGIGTGARDGFQFTGISLSSVLPTKYSAEMGYEGIVSHFGFPDSKTGDIVKDERFINSRKLFDELALKLNAATEVCDSRQRIENRFSLWQLEGPSSTKIALTDHGTVWRVSSGEDIRIDFEAPTPIQRIALMGCTAGLHKFLNEHTRDIQNLDTALGAIYADYCLPTRDYDACSVAVVRDEAEFNFLKNFANAAVPPVIDVSKVSRAEALQISTQQPPGELSDIVEVEKPQTSDATSTGATSSLGGQNGGEESDLTSLQFAYFVLLPIVGIGILAWVVVRVRKRKGTNIN